MYIQQLLMFAAGVNCRLQHHYGSLRSPAYSPAPVCAVEVAMVVLSMSWTRVSLRYMPPPAAEACRYGSSSELGISEVTCGAHGSMPAPNMSADKSTR